MIRDEKTGKFVAESEQQKLEWEIKEAQARLAELKKTEAQRIAEEKAVVRKADLVVVQDAANAYLKEVEENKKIRAELAAKENQAYNDYKNKLNDFSAKHEGYHLSYKVNGNNVEFKIEEARADSVEEFYKEQMDLMNKIFNSFPRIRW